MSPIDPADRVLLVRPSHFGRTHPETDLYEATRKWWIIGARRRDGGDDSPTHAVAVLDGHASVVYRIDQWIRDDESGRWAFEGAVDDEMTEKYGGVDLRNYFSRGAANPLRYVNCG